MIWPLTSKELNEIKFSDLFDGVPTTFCIYTLSQSLHGRLVMCDICPNTLCVVQTNLGHDSHRHTSPNTTMVAENPRFGPSSFQNILSTTVSCWSKQESLDEIKMPWLCLESHRDPAQPIQIDLAAAHWEAVPGLPVYRNAMQFMPPCCFSRVPISFKCLLRSGNVGLRVSRSEIIVEIETILRTPI